MILRVFGERDYQSRVKIIFHYDRSSMSSTGSGGSSKTTDTTTTSGISISSGASQIQEKAAKKRIHLINEMIQTEIYYVSDLETYLKTYYRVITEGTAELKVVFSFGRKMRL